MALPLSWNSFGKVACFSLVFMECFEIRDTSLRVRVWFWIGWDCARLLLHSILSILFWTSWTITTYGILTKTWWCTLYRRAYIDFDTTRTFSELETLWNSIVLRQVVQKRPYVKPGSFSRLLSSSSPFNIECRSKINAWYIEHKRKAWPYKSHFT